MFLSKELLVSSQVITDANLTNCMASSLPWEADNRSDAQENSYLY